MDFRKYLDLDYSAKRDSAACKLDVVFPEVFTYKRWNNECPTLEAPPLTGDRKIVIKIGGQELAVFSNEIWKDKVPVVEFIDQSSGELMGNYSAPLSFKDRAPLKSVRSSDISETLLSLYPWWKETDLNNIMIAGGSISTIIQNLSAGKSISIDDINDIDFFLYGMDPEACLNKIEYLITKIKAIYPDSTFIRTQCALTLVDKEAKNKFQIILSAYDSPSQILHSFDLGSCKAGIYLEDGNFKLMTTSLGLFCLEHRVNIVDARYHADTLPRRLLKYFKRGYSLVLPHFNMKPVQSESFKPGNKIELVSLTLQIDTVNGNRMTGFLIINKKPRNKVPLHEKKIDSDKSSLFPEKSELSSKKSESSLVPEKSESIPQKSDSSKGIERSYDEGFNFKKVHLGSYFDQPQCVKRFISGNYIFAVKVTDFTTGAEAIAKSSKIPVINPMLFRKYIPSIYDDNKLDLNVFENIPDFEFKEFMMCRNKGPAFVESYLFAIYYGPKILKYTEEFRKIHSDHAKLKIEQYKEGSFLHSQRSLNTITNQSFGQHFNPTLPPPIRPLGVPFM